MTAAVSGLRSDTLKLESPGKNIIVAGDCDEVSVALTRLKSPSIVSFRNAALLPTNYSAVHNIDRLRRPSDQNAITHISTRRGANRIGAGLWEGEKEGCKQ